MPVVLYAVLIAVEEHSTRRGQQYRWPYHRIGNAYGHLRRTLSETARNYPYHVTDHQQRDHALRQLAAAVQPSAAQFQAAYGKLTATHAPYDLCHACATCCRYRFEAANIAQRSDSQAALRHAFETKDDQAMWKQLTDYCRNAAAQIARGPAGQPPRDACICVAVHSALVARFSPATQTKMVRNVVNLLP